MAENKFDGVSDVDLLYSVGSHRPQSGAGLAELVAPMTPQELEKAQAEHDEAVEEMVRRHKKRGFPYRIPC